MDRINSKQRLFVDEDGTLNQYLNVQTTKNGEIIYTQATIDEMAAPGYCLNRPVQTNILSGVKLLLHHFDTYILSAAFDNAHSIPEKDTWGDMYIPEIDHNHRIYVPYGTNKSEYVKKATGYVSADDLLLDDYTPNLIGWHGIAIKCHSVSTNICGKWNGYVISEAMRPEIIAHTLYSISKVDNVFKK